MHRQPGGRGRDASADGGPSEPGMVNRHARAERAYAQEMQAARPDPVTGDREPYPVVVRRAMAAYDAVIRDRSGSVPARA
jgi:hypothetical protein